MLEILKTFENNYIVSYEGKAYIVFCHSDYFIVKLYIGRWQVWRPWRPYTHDDVFKYCKSEEEFISKIEQAILENKEKLDNEYEVRQERCIESEKRGAKEEYFYFSRPVPIDKV